MFSPNYPQVDVLYVRAWVCVRSTWLIYCVCDFVCFRRALRHWVCDVMVLVEDTQTSWEGWSGWAAASFPHIINGTRYAVCVCELTQCLRFTQRSTRWWCRDAAPFISGIVSLSSVFIWCGVVCAGVVCIQVEANMHMCTLCCVHANMPTSFASVHLRYKLAAKTSARKSPFF